MYKLLIVEDEDIVRTSIVNIIDWNKLGFSEVYEAEDGEQALKIALKIKPDLVLTDIKMPFMDGLELSAKLREQLPSTHIVILSGYEEFKFAQNAISLGVLDYILKPIGSASLSKKMLEIRKKLDKERKEKQQLEKIRKQLHQSLPLLKEKFLNNLVCTPGRKSAIKNKIEFFEIPLKEGPFAVCIIEPDLNDVNINDVELYSFAVKNIVADTVGPNNPVFSDTTGRIIVVFNISNLKEKNENKIRQIVCDTLMVIQKDINSHFKIPITSAIGNIVQTIDDLYASYCKALSALECKYTLGKDKIYDIYDLDYMEQEFFYPFDASTEFMTAVKCGRIDTINQALDQIAESLKNKKSLSSINIKMIFIEIVMNLLKLLAETKKTTATLWSDGISLFGMIEKLGTVEEMSNAIKPFAEKVALELTNARVTSGKKIVFKAMEYIRENYRLNNLSLNTTAAHVAVSPGYLSALFKKETGKNFSEYLTHIRMEKAIELLSSSDLKTYEVAYMTGFSNPHYFSICFKKYTGMSPSEFKGVSKNDKKDPHQKNTNWHSH